MKQAQFELSKLRAKASRLRTLLCGSLATPRTGFWMRLVWSPMPEPTRRRPLFVSPRNPFTRHKSWAQHEGRQLSRSPYDLYHCLALPAAPSLPGHRSARSSLTPRALTNAQA